MDDEPGIVGAVGKPPGGEQQVPAGLLDVGGVAVDGWRRLAAAAGDRDVREALCDRPNCRIDGARLPDDVTADIITVVERVSATFR